jgi:UDP-3-O-[3-hydroxymyristoyl] glucosamine N-acyltransferase
MLEQFRCRCFYTKKRAEGYDQLLLVEVVIKDNVGIWFTIDKGVTGDTTIGEGTKLTIKYM